MQFWRKTPKPEDVETFRDWLSQEQWQDAVREIQKRSLDLNGRERRDPHAPRHQAITRCLLRVERRGSVLGMLLVRSRNISSTGMCVVHGGRVPRRAKATIVIEAGEKTGLITTGRIVWCKPIKGARPLAHEIGIEFDAPIDVSAFIPGSPGTPGSPNGPHGASAVVA